MPLQKPVPRVRGPKRERRLSGASSRAATCGKSSDSPKPASTTSAITRTPLPATPTPFTSEASATTAIVNVRARPSTIPTGRRRPPTAPADSSAGSTGSTHGDTAVAAPATIAKSVSTSIVATNHGGRQVAKRLNRLAGRVQPECVALFEARAEVRRVGQARRVAKGGLVEIEVVRHVVGVGVPEGERADVPLALDEAQD